MAGSPTSTTLQKILQPVSRRWFLSSAAAMAISSPALASQPAGQHAAEVTATADKADYDPKAEPFDAKGYVDYMLAGNLDCYMICRDGKSIMYKYWSPQLVMSNPRASDREKLEAFHQELRRRDWVYHTLPGENAYQAERRVRELRERGNIGASVSEQATM